MWTDAEGRTRFIGIGKRLRNEEPFERQWRDRYRDGSAPIHVWLRTNYVEPPLPILVGGTEPLNRREAEDLFTVTRQQLLDAGEDLLSTRPLSTYRHGDGVEKPVVDDWGLQWPSLRAAARGYGINPSSAQRRVRSGLWRYSDEQPTQ
jgi:hypothetical protein